jgi:hypothetical protein
MAALAAVVLLVSGCGSGQGSSSAGDAPAVQSMDRQPVAPAATSIAGPQGNEAFTPADSKVKIQEPDRAIVYTGEMTIHAKDVTAAADRAKQIVTSAGGRLDREQSTSDGGESSSTIVFKIPPDRYPAVVEQLGRELGNRKSLNLGTEDVTQQIADVDSRVKSSKAALDQVRKFLARANTIAEVLKVEREISSREAELESLQARQRSLAAQTALGTLTLNIKRLVAPTPTPKPKPKPKPQPPNFFSGLEAGWHALTSTTRVALTVLGALLPWLIVVGVLWIAYIAVRRRAPWLQGPRTTRPSAPDGTGNAEEPDEVKAPGERDTHGEADEPGGS